MRFWDSSAILPLLVDQPSTAEARSALAADHQVVVWWGTPTECVSAIARLEREGVAGHAIQAALRRLAALQDSWVEVEPSSTLRDQAVRLLRTHPLRAGDALQLAAAITAAGASPTSPFVTLDDRLSLAADREGFPVTRFDPR
jgi:predicted nucleic acid-binding protein